MKVAEQLRAASGSGATWVLESRANSAVFAIGLAGESLSNAVTNSDQLASDKGVLDLLSVFGVWETPQVPGGVGG